MFPLIDREAEAYLILVEEPPVAKASSPAEVGGGMGRRSIGSDSSN